MLLLQSFLFLVNLWDARHGLLDSANITFETTTACVCLQSCSCAVRSVLNCSPLRSIYYSPGLVLLQEETLTNFVLDSCIISKLFSPEAEVHPLLAGSSVTQYRRKPKLTLFVLELVSSKLFSPGVHLLLAGSSVTTGRNLN